GLAETENRQTHLLIKWNLGRMGDSLRARSPRRSIPLTGRNARTTWRAPPGDGPEPGSPRGRWTRCPARLPVTAIRRKRVLPNAAHDPGVLRSRFQSIGDH